MDFNKLDEKMKVEYIIVIMMAIQLQVAWSQDSSDTQKMSNIMCQLYLGGIPLCPASSCKEIADTRLWNTRSGLHWLTNCNKLWKAYCSQHIFPSQSLGWMRVGYVSSRYGCPEGLGHLETVCQRVDVGCSSVIFPTHGISYSKVCRLVYGYIKGTPDRFERHRNCPGCTIDDPYVDGVSITHGSPRQHIWSLAATGHVDYCLCSATNFQTDEFSFVGQDYYCDVEGANTFSYANRLWDKYDCLPGAEACCEDGAWFCKDLPQPITDDIEFRLCADEVRANEDVYIEYAVIYVQ